jgi:hypothetical protein
MDMVSKNCVLDAEDRRVYSGWLRGTLFAYGAVVLFGIAMVAVQATTNSPNAAEFMATAIALAAP